jgi:hypothetical protein
MASNDCFVIDVTQRDVQDTNLKKRSMNLILFGRCSAVINIRYLPGTSQTQCRLNRLYLQNTIFKHFILKIVHIQKISRYSGFKSSEHFLKLPRVLRRLYTTFRYFRGCVDIVKFATFSKYIHKLFNPQTASCYISRRS